MTITTVDLTLELRFHDRGTTVPVDGTVDFTAAHGLFRMPPSYGGQTVRYLEGRTESRPYRVDVLDSTGLITGELGLSGRMALLGRIVDLRHAADGGAFTLQDRRRLSDVEYIGEGWYSIELSDERWVERRHLIFEKSTSVQLHPPGLTAPWINRRAAGTQTYFVDNLGTDYVALSIVSRPDGRTATEIVGLLREDLLEEPTITLGSFTSLRFEDSTSTDRPVLRFDPDIALFDNQGVVSQLRRPLGDFLILQEPFWTTALLYWPAHGFSSGDTKTGRFYFSTGIRTTAATPVLLGGDGGIRAPTLHKDIADGDHGGPVQIVDAAAFTTLATESFPPAWYSIKEPQPRDRWVETNLLRPYSVIPFIDSIGRLAPRSLRPPTDIDPTSLFTFDNTNVVGQVVWRHPGRDAVTVVRVEAHFRLRIEAFFVSLVIPITREATHDTLSLLGRREQVLNMDAIFDRFDFFGIFDGLKTDLFDRFGDGPQTGEFEALVEATSPVVGDLVSLDHDTLKGPNAETNTRGGKRFVHITDRLRAYTGGRVVYQYTYLDAGPSAQPLAVPTVAIIKTVADPKHSVDITVSALPAGATAIVQIATTAIAGSPVAADWITARTDVGNETITIPRRPSGKDIHTRAFSTAPNRNRSAASTVQKATLDTITVPSALVAAVTGRSVKLTATLVDVTEQVEFTIDGVGRALAEPATTIHTFHGLEPVLTTFGVRHRDYYGGVSALATTTATPVAKLNAPTLQRLTVEVRSFTENDNDRKPLIPEGFEEIDAFVPASAVEGAVRWMAVIRVSPADETFAVVVERAPNSGGSPDEANRVNVLTLAAGDKQGFDTRPQDGSLFWYRGFHRRLGWNDGTPTAWVKATFDDLDEKKGPVENVDREDVVIVNRDTPFDDSGYAVKAETSDGIGMDSGVGISEGSARHSIYRHREEILVLGADADGDVPVTFGQAYQNAPMIVLAGGQFVSFSTGLGSGVFQRLRLEAVDVTASGFTSRSQITNAGAATAQTDEFASGAITVVGNTKEANLDPAVANDDRYTSQFFVSVTAIKAVETLNLCTLVVAIDTNDGGGWVERWTGNYSSGADPGGDNTETWTQEMIAVVVSALGLNDDIRLRAKSFVTGPEGGSFIIRGGDAGGANPEAYSGVLYNTASDTTESAIPSAGDSVRWVAQEVV